MTDDYLTRKLDELVPTKNLVRGGADAAMGYPLLGCSTS